jgi:AraC-like DNA-binding protein
MRALDHRLRDLIGDDVPFYAERFRGVTATRDLPGGMSYFFQRDYDEIIAFVRGTARNVVYTDDGGERTEAIRAGDIFLWRPRDRHILFSEADTSFEFLQVRFRPADWAAFAGLAGIPPAAWNAERSPRGRFDPADPRVPAAYDAAISAFQAGASVYDLVRFWSDVVPVLFPPQPAAGQATATPAWLTSSLREMSSESALRAGLPRLLQLAHVSPRQLARVTARYMGRTPTELIEDLRLRHAARLLLSSSTPISEISDRSGFSSPAYFSKRFSRATGISPRRYRQRGSVERTAL